MKAIWNNMIVAESDETVVVEGNHYFPLTSVNLDYLRPSAHKTVCPWKGTASYYDLVGDGKENLNGAWYYPETKAAAKNIEGYVAFYPIVKVTHS